MISPELNKFLSYQKKQGKLAGCYYEKSREKYKANINIDGKVKTLGRFETELDAHLCWLKAKSELLLQFFNTESQDVVDNLKSIYFKMEEHINKKLVWTH